MNRAYNYFSAMENHFRCMPPIRIFLANGPLFRFFTCIVLILVTHLPVASFAVQLDLPKDASGWTIFTPSADTRIVYVSNTGSSSCTSYAKTDALVGNDPFNPSGSVIPCTTYALALAQARTGYPDWILFKRGDTWIGKIYNVPNGRSATEPFLIGAYGGSGDLPLIKHGVDVGLSIRRASSSTKSSAQFIAISSLNFYSHTRDPNNTKEYTGVVGNLGVSVQSYLPGNAVSSILIEGCKFIYPLSNELMSGAGSVTSGITLRRNLFLSSYPESTGAQGLYSESIAELILEENIFDHNGWYSIAGSGGIGQANVYNHNVYTAGGSDIVFRNNIFMRGSNMNTKFTTNDAFLTNVTVDNNLYIGGQIGLNMETNYLSTPDRVRNAVISNNVFTKIGMENITGQGIGWYMELAGWANGSVKGNLMVNSPLAPAMGTLGIKTWGGMHNTSINNNIMYGVAKGSGDNSYALTFSSNSALDIYGNKFHSIETMPLIQNASSTLGTNTIHDNLYYSASASGFVMASSAKSFSDWQEATGDNSTFGAIPFTEPTRSIETYMQSVGENATLDVFIAKCRGMNRYNWDPRFTATNINNWIRGGFIISHIQTPSEFKKID